VDDGGGGVWAKGSKGLGERVGRLDDGVARLSECWIVKVTGKLSIAVLKGDSFWFERGVRRRSKSLRRRPPAIDGKGAHVTTLKVTVQWPDMKAL